MGILYDAFMEMVGDMVMSWVVNRERPVNENAQNGVSVCEHVPLNSSLDNFDDKD